MKILINERNAERQYCNIYIISLIRVKYDLILKQMFYIRVTQVTIIKYVSLPYLSLLAYQEFIPCAN